MVVVVVGRWLLSLSLVVIFVAGYRCCWLCTSLSQAALSLSLLSAGSDVGWCRLRVLSLARQRWVPAVFLVEDLTVELCVLVVIL